MREGPPGRDAQVGGLKGEEEDFGGRKRRRERERRLSPGVSAGLSHRLLTAYFVEYHRLFTNQPFFITRRLLITHPFLYIFYIFSS